MSEENTEQPQEVTTFGEVKEKVRLEGGVKEEKKIKCQICGSESFTETIFDDVLNEYGRPSTEKETKCNGCGNRKTVTLND